MPMLEKALVLIKPDSYERGLHSEIFQRIEESNLKIVARKILMLTEEMIRAYQPVLNEPSEFGEGWKNEVILALTRLPVEILIVEGDDAILKISLLKRQMRAEYCYGCDYQSRVIFNLIHSADNISELENNINILFPEIAS